MVIILNWAFKDVVQLNGLYPRNRQIWSAQLLKSGLQLSIPSKGATKHGFLPEFDRHICRNTEECKAYNRLMLAYWVIQCVRFFLFLYFSCFWIIIIENALLWLYVNQILCFTMCSISVKGWSPSASRLQKQRDEISLGNYTRLYDSYSTRYHYIYSFLSTWNGCNKHDRLLAFWTQAPY